MMRFISVFLTAAASVIGTLASPAEYDDLVLTNIAVKEIENTNRVRFGGTMAGANESHFLTNIVKTNSTTGPFWKRRPVFEAEIVPTRTLQKEHSLSLAEHYIKKHTPTEGVLSKLTKKRKPLLCIHGFNVKPEDHLKKCRKYKDSFKKYKLIPVIWPSKGGILNYYFDKTEKGSEGAGKTFKESLEKFAGKFPSKSLLAHSMGNRVLRFAADPAFKFDNIFMVAADVDGEIFNKDYIKKDDKGLLISKMLDPDKGGKIWVVQNKNDYALRTSKFINLEARNIGRNTKVWPRPRLGAEAINVTKLDDELKEKIDTVDAGPWLKKNKILHSYQFDDNAIEFYEGHL